MPKLQKKAIKLVILLYVVVLILGAIFSYLIIFRPLESEAIEGYERLNSFILGEMESSIQSIEEFTNTIAYSGELLAALERFQQEGDSQELRHEIGSILNTFRNVRTGVRSSVIQLDDETIFLSLLPPSAIEMLSLEQDWYRDVVDRVGSRRFSRGIQVPREMQELPDDVIAFSKRYRIRDADFIVTVFWDYTETFGRVERFRSLEFERSYWLSPRSELLFADDEADKSDLLLLLEEGQEIYRRGDGVYFMNRLFRYPFVSITFVSSSSLSRVFNEYLQMITLFLIAAFSLTLLGTLFTVRRLTNPVIALSKVMASAVDMDLNVEAHSQSTDEVGELSHVFNHMISEMKDYVQKVLENEKKEQEMRFGLLASQVDPHFVCNTLNTVNYLAKMQRHEDVMVVSKALSNILRDRLRLKEFEIYDTIEQEIATVKQHLTILKYRYGDKVHVSWEIQPEVLAMEIPKNLIQPLIENSIYHGLADEDTGEIRGNIWIYIGRQDEYLQIAVTDDGRGIAFEKIAELNRGEHVATEKGRGIGIYSIREQLSLLYGDEYMMRIVAGWQQGTTVSIQFKY